MLGYLLFCLIKYFLINLVALNSNEAIHEDMINGLVRSPSFYFDIIPSGRLNNYFSNDLGILDNMLPFVLVDCIEGPISCVIILSSIFTINVFFIIPAVISVVFIALFFMYCKKTIIELKRLDLVLKNPVFNMVGEMVNSLIQIRIFNRRYGLLNTFATKLNNSLRVNLCFWNLSKAFGTFISLFTTFIVCLGWVMGIAIITK